MLLRVLDRRAHHRSRSRRSLELYAEVGREPWALHVVDDRGVPAA